MLIQFVLILLMVMAFVVTWRRVRQRIIHAREALGWSVVWIVAAIVVLRPEISTRIANLFGIGRGADFMMYVSVAVLFLLVFRLFLQHEKLERTITALVQKDALRGWEDEAKPKT